MLDKMMRTGEAAIRRHVGKKDTLLPVWHVIHEDGQSEVIGTPWGNQNEKFAVLDMLRAFFRDTNVVAYCFTVEAWTTPPMSKEEAQKIAPGGDIERLRPSVMPDRVEVFMAHASDGTSARMKMWDIRRDKRGRVQAIIERHDLGDDSMYGGTIASMLKAQHIDDV